MEPYIRHGRSLQVAPEFKSIKQRPRELLGNWLICAIGCDARGKESLAVGEDPLGGDGLIVDKESDDKLFMEHVYVPAGPEGEFEDRVMAALQAKAAKGEEYAKGRTLVIFADAVGKWFPNRLARRIAGQHHFRGVWLVALDAPSITNGTYAYNVAELDVSNGNASVSRVVVSPEFDSWTVETIQ